MTNEEYLKIQERAKADAEAGRARSNDYTSSGVANDLYNSSYGSKK